MFSQLRADSAARFVEDLGVWVVSRHDDVRAVLSDPETLSNALTLVPVVPVCPQAGQMLGELTNDPVTAGADGPTHARTRRAVMAVFPSNPLKASAWTPMVRAIADDLVERMTARDEGTSSATSRWNCRCA